jgi:Holliday junction resolvase RusA-like endonuclease
MRTLEFTLPFATPSNNAVMRMHHRVRSKEHLNNRLEVWAAAGANPCLSDKCIVTVTRHSSRFLDWDNMGGGLKFLLDAMVKNGIIEDDNPKCIVKLNLEQVKCKQSEAKTVVKIKSLTTEREQ